MRRAAKIDANQPEIIKALRDAGAQVIPTHMMGEGFPDLLVNFNQRCAHIEIKDGSKPPSDRRLTPAQLKFHREWQGGTLAVVNDIEGALRVLEVMK